MKVERICIDQHDRRYGLMVIEVCDVSNATDDFIEFLTNNDELGIGMDSLKNLNDSTVINATPDEIASIYCDQIGTANEGECFYVLKEDSGEIVKTVDANAAARHMSKELYNRLLNR